MQRVAIAILFVLGLHAASAGLLSPITTPVVNLLTPPSTPSTPSTPMGTGSGAADPQVVDFSGRHFEFIGRAGSFYNVIQDLTHQVTMRLKIGILSDHIGTYIDGIGFAYQGHKIVIGLAEEDDAVTVSLDGEKFAMARGENRQEHVLALPQGKLKLAWELYRPNFGNTITITTDLLRFTAYRTDKGSLDKGGLPQPAFLNFDASLLYPPGHTIQGIVGEGYTRVLNGEAHLLPNDGAFYGNPDEYELPHYFPADSPATRKILLPGGTAYRRLLTPEQPFADLTAAADALHTARAGGLLALPEMPAV